jgi:hypothetical protein
MEQVPGQNWAARRNEDIALDLLKFVASTAGVGRPTAPSTGFTAPAGAKSDDQASHLLELYSRCLRAVEGKPDSAPEVAPKR